MNKKITAKFVRKRFQDSGSSQAPDYFVYEFTDILDELGNKISDKWMKETKLLKNVPFQKGKQYEITLSERGFPIDSIRLPFPKEIVWDNERVYMKGGNSIVKVSKDKAEKNLSIPINKITRVSNYDTAAFNKFSKGLMTEDLLLKMNARGVFYNVHFYDHQDRRKFGDSSIGYSTSSKENQVLIQKETQSELERALETIKSKYITKAIEKYFNFKTELLPPKMNYTDRIFPTNKGLTTYLDELIAKNYQIPTFQRDVVWESENVKKLWDSIYKFYPLGSILIWKTDLKLQNHRQIGGHQITDTNFSRTEYQYILDGQQRTTSLLTSLYGGTIESRPDFNPLLYVDLTVPIDSETDDESYRNRFLFWSEIDDRNGEIKPNIGKKKRFKEGLIVKLIEIKNNFTTVQSNVFNSSEINKDFNHPVLAELAKIKGVLDNYRISFIEVKGIQVSEVCQIFERINQAGKPLNIFDIVVAKTFKPGTPQAGSIPADNGFYLRDLIDDFRKHNNSEFLKISDQDYLQILAVIISRNIHNSGVRNITDRYLNEIKTEHILEVWEDTKKAILKTFDFFENHLHIKTPHLIPFRYFYFTITAYFYKNVSPDYNLLKKYFWFNSFHNADLLSNTTQVAQHIDFLYKGKNGEPITFERFLIDKQKLRSATYSSKGRMSRAILALYSSVQPKDWEHCDREVLVQNFFFSTDKPNLHHIFPTNSEYVLNNQHKNKITSDSLMNIAYLTQITNLDITNRNPLEYMKDYDKPEFEAIMPSHLLSNEILNWARSGTLPDNAIDLFIESRVNGILSDLKIKLSGVTFDEMDTMEIKESLAAE